MLYRPSALLVKRTGQCATMIKGGQLDGHLQVVKRRQRCGRSTPSVPAGRTHQVVAVTERRARQSQAILSLGQREPPEM